jgi:hypothetical protein
MFFKWVLLFGVVVVMVSALTPVALVVGEALLMELLM